MQIEFFLEREGNPPLFLVPLKKKIKNLQTKDRIFGERCVQLLNVKIYCNKSVF
jgi:hypothetical protein